MLIEREHAGQCTDAAVAIAAAKSIIHVHVAGPPHARGRQQTPKCCVGSLGALCWEVGEPSALQSAGQMASDFQ